MSSKVILLLLMISPSCTKVLNSWSNERSRYMELIGKDEAIIKEKEIIDVREDELSSEIELNFHLNSMDKEIEEIIGSKDELLSRIRRSEVRSKKNRRKFSSSYSSSSSSSKTSSKSSKSSNNKTIKNSSNVSSKELPHLNHTKLHTSSNSSYFDSKDNFNSLKNFSKQFEQDNYKELKDIDGEIVKNNTSNNWSSNSSHELTNSENSSFQNQSSEFHEDDTYNIDAENNTLIDNIEGRESMVGRGVVVNITYEPTDRNGSDNAKEAQNQSPNEPKNQQDFQFGVNIESNADISGRTKSDLQEKPVNVNGAKIQDRNLPDDSDESNTPSERDWDNRNRDQSFDLTSANNQRVGLKVYGNDSTKERFPNENSKNNGSGSNVQIDIHQEYSKAENKSNTDNKENSTYEIRSKEPSFGSKSRPENDLNSNASKSVNLSNGELEISKTTTDNKGVPRGSDASNGKTLSINIRSKNDSREQFNSSRKNQSSHTSQFDSARVDEESNNSEIRYRTRDGGLQIEVTNDRQGDSLDEGLNTEINGSRNVDGKVYLGVNSKEISDAGDRSTVRKQENSQANGIKINIESEGQDIHVTGINSNRSSGDLKISVNSEGDSSYNADRTIHLGSDKSPTVNEHGKRSKNESQRDHYEKNKGLEVGLNIGGDYSYNARGEIRLRSGKSLIDGNTKTEDQQRVEEDGIAIYNNNSHSPRDEIPIRSGESIGQTKVQVNGFEINGDYGSLRVGLNNERGHSYNIGGELGRENDELSKVDGTKAGEQHEVLVDGRTNYGNDGGLEVSFNTERDYSHNIRGEIQTEIPTRVNDTDFEGQPRDQLYNIRSEVPLGGDADLREGFDTERGHSYNRRDEVTFEDEESTRIEDKNTEGHQRGLINGVKINGNDKRLDVGFNTEKDHSYRTRGEIQPGTFTRVGETNFEGQTRDNLYNTRIGESTNFSDVKVEGQERALVNGITISGREDHLQVGLNTDRDQSYNTRGESQLEGGESTRGNNANIDGQQTVMVNAGRGNGLQVSLNTERDSYNTRDEPKRVNHGNTEDQQRVLVNGIKINGDDSSLEVGLNTEKTYSYNARGESIRVNGQDFEDQRRASVNGVESERRVIANSGKDNSFQAEGKTLLKNGDSTSNIDERNRNRDLQMNVNGFKTGLEIKRGQSDQSENVENDEIRHFDVERNEGLRNNDMNEKRKYGNISTYIYVRTNETSDQKKLNDSRKDKSSVNFPEENIKYRTARVNNSFEIRFGENENPSTSHGSIKMNISQENVNAAESQNKTNSVEPFYRISIGSNDDPKMNNSESVAEDLGEDGYAEVDSQYRDSIGIKNDGIKIQLSEKHGPGYVSSTKISDRDTFVVYGSNYADGAPNSNSEVDQSNLQEKSIVDRRKSENKEGNIQSKFYGLEVSLSDRNFEARKKEVFHDRVETLESGQPTRNIRIGRDSKSSSNDKNCWDGNNSKSVDLNFKEGHCPEWESQLYRSSKYTQVCNDDSHCPNAQKCCLKVCIDPIFDA